MQIESRKLRCSATCYARLTAATLNPLSDLKPQIGASLISDSALSSINLPSIFHDVSRMPCSSLHSVAFAIIRIKHDIHWYLNCDTIMIARRPSPVRAVIKLRERVRSETELCVRQDHTSESTTASLTLAPDATLWGIRCPSLVRTQPPRSNMRLHLA